MTTIRKTTQSTSSASARAPETKPASTSTAARSTNTVKSPASDVSSFTSTRTSSAPVVLQPPAPPAVARTTALSAPSTQGGATPERRVSTDFLNLRTAPTTAGNTPVAVIPPGAELQVTPDATGATRKDGFLHVSWNDGTAQRSGWVSEAYTRAATPQEPTQGGTVGGPAPVGTPAEGGPEYLRTTDAVNLRTAPTTAGNTPVAVIPRGTQVQVTPDATGATRKEGFVHVSWNDGGTQRDGWVSEQYMRASSEPRPRTETDAQALERAQGLHINQFDAETQVGGDGRNANCGPTSVVMALRDQGLTLPAIPGVANNGTDGADIQAARFHMYNGVDAARDGVEQVDPNNAEAGYRYAPMSGTGNENSSYTGFDGVQRAVEAAGGVAETLSADSASVAQAVRDGKAVVISGTFVEVPPGGGAKQEKTDTWTRGGGAEEHLVTVTGVTSDGNFIVCDPALRSPVVVTPEQLDAFMRGNAGAMSVDGTP